MATYSLEITPNPPEDNVTGYNAYQHVGADYNLLGAFDANLKFDLGQPKNGDAYAATAVNAEGESDKSSDAIFQAVPSAPAAPKIVVS